jgi:hypothetical protein
MLLIKIYMWYVDRERSRSLVYGYPIFVRGNVRPTPTKRLVILCLFVMLAAYSCNSTPVHWSNVTLWC